MFKAVLIDLSGTIHVEDKVIEGAVQAIKRLRASNLGIRFATNTTKESQRLLHERLGKLGFDIKPAEIFTSLTAARDLIKKEQLKPYLMIDDAAMEDFSGHVPIDTPVEDTDAVLVGLAPAKFNYEQMNIAMNILLRGAKLFAVHKGRYYKRSDGLALGPGPFITALEHSTDANALVVGKPQNTFFLEAISGFDCKPNQVFMIGDDVRDDVKGAQDVGMVGILVKTGKYRAGDERLIDPAPGYVCDSIVEAVDKILSLI